MRVRQRAQTGCRMGGATWRPCEGQLVFEDIIALLRYGKLRQRETRSRVGHSADRGRKRNVYIE
jgi:hypothetical protein